MKDLLRNGIRFMARTGSRFETYRNIVYALVERRNDHGKILEGYNLEYVCTLDELKETLDDNLKHKELDFCDIIMITDLNNRVLWIRED